MIYSLCVYQILERRYYGSLYNYVRTTSFKLLDNQASVQMIAKLLRIEKENAITFVPDGLIITCYYFTGAWEARLSRRVSGTFAYPEGSLK